MFLRVGYIIVLVLAGSELNEKYSNIIIQYLLVNVTKTEDYYYCKESLQQSQLYL